MKTVGIIAEYNPFHLGHKYQIEKIREFFGSETAIIAVMSGNLTQRGEVAIFDKAERAKAAVLCGVNLVLELPFPYCSSGAEFFATSGVEILNSLGVLDYLSFGAECDDINKLEEAVRILSDIPTKESRDSVGYAKRCGEIYKDAAGSEENILTPNNILAIEYIKALKKSGSKTKSLPILRQGDAYSQKEAKSKMASAMAIREILYKNDMSAFDYIPKEAKNVFLSAVKNGIAPCRPDSLDKAVISNLRINSPRDSENEIHDAGGGLYNRIIAKSFYADSISSLVELVKTKKYTTARIRRAIWYSYLGVTSSDVRCKPAYTQILAMDGIGAALLKQIKKETDFPILTKPSADEGLNPDARRQKALSDKADSVLQLTKPRFVRGDAGLLFSPFVKK